MRSFLILSILITSSMPTFAETEILHDGDRYVVVKFTVPEITSQEVSRNGQFFTKLEIPGYSNNNLPGSPLLPRLTTTLAIPAGHYAHATLLAADTGTFSIPNPLLIKPIENEPKETMTLDQIRLLEFGKTGFAGPIYTQNMTFSPIRKTSDPSVFRLCKQATFRIEFRKRYRVPATPPVHANYAPERLKDILAPAYINQAVFPRFAKFSRGETLFFIVPENLEQRTLPLINQYAGLGFNVFRAILSAETSKEDIDLVLKKRYGSKYPPLVTVLVEDASPASATHPVEVSKTIGPDSFPDILTIRADLSKKQPLDLENQLNHSLIKKAFDRLREDHQ